MMPAQLKETTMDPAKRSLLRVVLLANDQEGTADSVERLMGTKAEAQFAFITDKAELASDDLLDVWNSAVRGGFRAVSGIFGRLAPESAPFFRPFRGARL